jgi:hypothetical protein
MDLIKKTLEASTKRMRRVTEVEGCNLAKLTARRSLRRLVQDRLYVDSWCCETRTQKMGEIKNKTEELCKQGDTKPNLMFTRCGQGKNKINEGSYESNVLLDDLPCSLQVGLYWDNCLLDEEVIQARSTSEERVESISDK